MAINRVVLGPGEVSSYGPKIEWTEKAGKPQTSFTLVLHQGEYKTFIPCVCVGAKAEQLAETLTAGDRIIVEGSLSWRSGKTKDAGRLQVVCFDVEVVQPAPAMAETAGSRKGEADDSR
jgi:single-stranded DNA-binding protein